MDNTNITENQGTAISMVRYYIHNAGLRCINRNFAVIDALGPCLNMYIINADGNVFQCTASRQVQWLGLPPVIRVIAERIVNTVNMNAHLIPSDNAADIQQEVRRHYNKATRVADFIAANPDRDSIKLATAFACAPGAKHPVVLPVAEIRAASATYARQYPQVFCDFLASACLRVTDLEKVLLLGNTLDCGDVKSEYMQLNDNRFVNYTGNPDLYIQQLPPLEDQAASNGAEDPEATMFEMQAAEPKPEPKPKISLTSAPAAPPEPPKPTVQPPAPPVQPPAPPASAVQPPAPPVPQPVSVQNLVLASLKQGAWVRLDTFDPTPGKGAAYQELEYQGNGMFKVISSGRSLAPGDMAKAYASAWNVGMQVDLDVSRAGRPLGRFRTRVVKGITIKQ